MAGTASGGLWCFACAPRAPVAEARHAGGGVRRVWPQPAGVRCARPARHSIPASPKARLACLEGSPVRKARLSKPLEDHCACDCSGGNPGAGSVAAWNRVLSEASAVPCLNAARRRFPPGTRRGAAAAGRYSRTATAQCTCSARWTGACCACRFRRPRATSLRPCGTAPTATAQRSSRAAPHRHPQPRSPCTRSSMRPSASTGQVGPGDPPLSPLHLAHGTLLAPDRACARLACHARRWSAYTGQQLT